MFSDTLTITINAVAKNLVRINQDRYSSEYFLREGTGEFRLRIRNTSYVDKTRKSITVDRHNVEFTHVLYPVAPATMSTQRKAYAVFENDRGDTIVDPVRTAVGAFAFLSEANLTKLANWES
jgi:hypothetical protein